MTKANRSGLSVFFLAVFAMGSLLLSEKEAFAKCEAALARLQQAEASLNAANQAYQAAKDAYDKARLKLDQAVDNLNAVAQKLGATGKATAEGISFGRSPSNPTFFETAEYKAAKQAWQDAKAAKHKAEGELDAAGQERRRAQDEYEDAKKEYERLRAEHLRAERIGDAGFLLEPEPLKLDEKLTEEVRKVIPDQVLYDAVREGDTVSDLAFVLRRVGNRTILETSVISKGQGAQSRRWKPENPFLVTPSGRISSTKTSSFYSRKPSAAGGVAPILFAAIGSQYERHASQAQQSQGTSCPTTGSGTAKQGPISKTVDRVGMAAGLGLLASQAGGELTGMRASFDVTGHESELKNALFKCDIVNRDAHKQVSITVPVRFDV